MSKVFVSDAYLSDIADAIRAKNGAQTQYYPREMAAAIIALDAEEHKPIQVNIQQSEHQTIKVKVKQKELQNTTVNANLELPETIQLEATVTADEGYTPGTLNQSLVNVEWGDTITFSATEASVLQKTIRITFNAVPEEYQSEMPQDYIFTQPYGTAYDIAIPALETFTASPERITGICTDNKTFTVTYTKNSANCTLQLRDSSGYSMGASYSGTIGNLPVSGNASGQLVLSGYYGEQFSITFTPPEGYRISVNPITGTLNNRTHIVRFMPTEDVIDDL